MDFYDEYLRELAALDEFLSRRRRSATFIEPEDPDVRRLTESLAFFAARTRQGAADQLRAAVDQLCAGLLDDFIHPQPARMMVRARPRPGLIETAALPRGTQLRVETSDGVRAHFSTMDELIIRPIELDRAELSPRHNGVRVLLRLRAFGPINHLEDPVTIQLRLPGGDYLRTREFADSFETALTRVGVVYDEVPASDDEGLECEVRVGAPLRSADGAAAMRDELRSMQRSGAVAEVRRFLHFPERCLNLSVSLSPPSARRTWRQAWLCLDLSDWPEGQQVNAEMFRLHTVGVENLVIEDARSFKADGTQTTFALLPVRTDPSLKLHSVTEVLQEHEGGLKPLLPSYLAGGDESWELLHRADEEVPHARVRLPRAFVDPRIVMIKARWYQPSFDRFALGKLAVSLHRRHVDGVSFEAVGGLTPHRASPLRGDANSMLHMLSRRAKWELSRADITMTMRVLGADDASFHGPVEALLRRVEVHDAPPPPGSRGGVQHVYRVDVAEEGRAVELRGLVRDYLGCVGRLVDAWSNNPAVLSDEDTRRRAPLRSVS